MQRFHFNKFDKILPKPTYFRVCHVSLDNLAPRILGRDRKKNKINRKNKIKNFAHLEWQKGGEINSNNLDEENVTDNTESEKTVRHMLCNNE